VGGASRLVQVVRGLDEVGVGIDDIALRRPTLDDVFLSLTGHAAEQLPSDEEEQETAAATSGRDA
jgi:ABC-2 type transport system ATP-binding protein